MDENADPTANEVFAEAVRKSKLGGLSADDGPSGAGMLAAVGGIRGLIESILPSLVFLVLYLVTDQDLLLSALVPIGIALVFVVIRYGTRSPVTPAITGAIGVAITGGLAIITGRGSNNFLPGLLLNAAFLVALLVSLAARRPLVGVIVAVLIGEGAKDWREEPRKRRMLTISTWLWVGLFAIRLAVELPLYLLDATVALGIAKLVLGVPLYAATLWVTWLLVRQVFPSKEAARTAE